MNADKKFGGNGKRRKGNNPTAKAGTAQREKKKTWITNATNGTNETNQRILDFRQGSRTCFGFRISDQGRGHALDWKPAEVETDAEPQRSIVPTKEEKVWITNCTN
jgi:hypothetical protein